MHDIGDRQDANDRPGKNFYRSTIGQQRLGPALASFPLARPLHLRTITRLPVDFPGPSELLAEGSFFSGHSFTGVTGRGEPVPDAIMLQFWAVQWAPTRMGLVRALLFTISVTKDWR